MKNKYVLAGIIIAMTILSGCKDDAYYGSELPGGWKTTVGFSGAEETITVLNSFDGIPKFEEAALSIPIKIYTPLKEDITVKLVQNDVLLDTYYKSSRFGFNTFPEGVLEAGSVTIPAGKTEAIVKISLQDSPVLSNDKEYLSAFGMTIEGNNPGIQVFGVQCHFVKAVQKRSENVAELSINGKEIALAANNPSGYTVLNSEGVSFTITTSIAQERKVSLSLQKTTLLLEHFYKGDTDGFLPFPEGVLEDMIIEIPVGETQVEVILPFANTDKLIDQAGYLTAFKLKEFSEDRRYASVSDDAYFFVKVRQTTSVGLGNRYSWGSLLNKSRINAFANGGDLLLPAVVDGNNSGDFFEIAKSGNGSIELIFDASQNVRDLTLQTNVEESGITSFYVAVTRDNGKTWLPRGMVKTNGAKNNFNLSFNPYARIDGIRLYGVKGEGSGLKVYEATPYITSW